jgi:hypothetical protein
MLLLPGGLPRESYYFKVNDDSVSLAAKGYESFLKYSHYVHF